MHERDGFSANTLGKSLLLDHPTETYLKKIGIVQNFASRIVSGAKMYDYITSILVLIAN